jgi:hypothetical protein
MKLKINLNKIKKLSEKNDRENLNFRSFLKGYKEAGRERIALRQISQEAGIARGNCADLR